MSDQKPLVRFKNQVDSVIVAPNANNEEEQQQVSTTAPPLLQEDVARAPNPTRHQPDVPEDDNGPDFKDQTREVFSGPTLADRNLSPNDALAPPSPPLAQEPPRAHLPKNDNGELPEFIDQARSVNRPPPVIRNRAPNDAIEPLNLAVDATEEACYSSGCTSYYFSNR